MTNTKLYKEALRKQSRAKFSRINLSRNDLLKESIDKSQSKQLKDICAFNPNSYLNLKIVKEASTVYLDEVEGKTEPFSKFKDFVVRQYDMISNDFPEKHIELRPYDFDSKKEIAGNIMLYATLPNDQKKAEIFVDKISKIALHFGYNYVGHDIDDMYAPNAYEVQLQFEATYFPGNVKTGDILWHVTTKNIADKVVNQKKGLVPRSESLRGFSYPSRIYCFKVLDKDLMKKYAANSWKSNKRFALKTEDMQKIVKDYWIELMKKELGSVYDTKEFAILKIDTSKLNCKFYRDNVFEYDDQFVAVYTNSNIPASAIEIVETFERD